MQISRRGFGAGLAGTTAVAAAGFTRAQTARLSHSEASAIDKAMMEFIAAGLAPGGWVGVMHKGEVLLSRSYGMENLETNSPMTADCVFRVGSITKQFTAASIMLLVQDGRLSVDDPLAKYISEMTYAGPITLRTMLTHASGIKTYTDNAFAKEARSPHSSKQMVDYIAALHPINDFPPGTAWHYSNSNFYLLCAIVERVSGSPLSTFLAERVLRRAGLRATALDQEAEVVPNRASGYVPLSSRLGAYRKADSFPSIRPAGPARCARPPWISFVGMRRCLRDRSSTASHLIRWSLPLAWHLAP